MVYSTRDVEGRMVKAMQDLPHGNRGTPKLTLNLVCSAIQEVADVIIS